MPVEFPVDFLKEIGFEDPYLTPEQEERFEIVLGVAMPYEKEAFDAYYMRGHTIDEIAASMKRSRKEIIRWIARVSAKVVEEKEYILTGEY